MTEQLALYIETLAAYAPAWGFLLIFVFMSIESSFIPFPSEVVMIPAGFLAMRGELSCRMAAPDLLLAFIAGLAGSMAGAYVNYYLAKKMGRPFLYAYGKYFFLPEPTLRRAEEIFREYGDLATFVCRLLPAIRQLISIPAGLSAMNIRRFSAFTALGAGIWCLVLLGIGAYFGHLSGAMTYPELIERGSAILKDNLHWIILGTVIVTVAYVAVHHRIMKTSTPPPGENL